MTDHRYTLAELEALPTLATGQVDNLKVDTGYSRVWLCRCGIADGMPADHWVTVETLSRLGRWETVDEYEAV